MIIFKRLPLILSIICFLIMVVNVVVSSIIIISPITCKLAQPILIVLLPLELLFTMGYLRYACNYEDNVKFILGILKRKRLYIFLLYCSAYLINPLLLFVYTKSYNPIIQPWGLIRCLPILNIFLYFKLIADDSTKNRLITYRQYISLYLKGKLLISIVNKDFK